MELTLRSHGVEHFTWLTLSCPDPGRALWAAFPSLAHSLHRSKVDAARISLPACVCITVRLQALLRYLCFGQCIGTVPEDSQGPYSAIYPKIRVKGHELLMVECRYLFI